MTTLVFCAGAAEPNLSVLRQTDYDVLIGVDAGAARLAAAGFAPDLAIGDFDTATPPLCAQTVCLPAEKDDTDLEAALMHVLPHYPPQSISKIIILGALGSGRLDHLLANVWLAHQPRFAAYRPYLHFIEINNSLRFLDSGCHTVYREQNKKYLSFIGLTALQGLTLTDVKYPLQNADYAHPCALISNEFLGCLAQMQCSLKSGLLAVVQSRDPM